MPRIKIGQIGVCHEHAAGKINALRTLPDVYEIVGVVDDRQSAAAKFAGGDLQPYGGLKWMTETELLNYPGLQAVTVETPNGDLVPTAMRCMERNLAMHMDKPGGADMKMFRTLIEGCKVRRLPFQMGYMFRNNPAMQWCLQAARANWLGDIFAVQAGMSHDYGGSAYQQYLADFQGGIMFNLGCHLIDFVVALLGRPAQITPVLKSTADAPANARNNCLAILEYKHAIVALHASSMEVDGIHHRRLKICGTKGAVELSPLERFDGQPLQMRLTLAAGNEQYPAGPHIVDFGVKHDRYHDQLLELAAIINGRMPNPYKYAHDCLVQEVVLAASGL